MDLDVYEIILNLYSIMMFMVMCVIPIFVIVFLLSRFARFIRRSFNAVMK